MRAGQYCSCDLAIGFREGARHLGNSLGQLLALVSGKAPLKGKFFVGLMAGAALFAVLTQPATVQARGQEPTCKNAAVSARITALYSRIARYENRLEEMKRERDALYPKVEAIMRMGGNYYQRHEVVRYGQLSDSIAAHESRLEEMRYELAQLDALPPCNPPPPPYEVALGTTSPAQSQTVLYVGGDIAFTTTHNEYGDVPAFSSDGPGAGAHVGLRYYFLRNVFVGFEAGWIGTSIRGSNLDGAFTNYDWQAWQMGQLGVTFTPQGLATPVTAYMGLGATQGRVTVGFDSGNFHESMSDILTGTVVRAGVEFNIKPNWTIGASYQHSWFSGTIGGDLVKTQLNTALLTVNYMITPRF
jgi:opacity protein-like surface antigen